MMKVPKRLFRERRREPEPDPAAAPAPAPKPWHADGWTRPGGSAFRAQPAEADIDLSRYVIFTPCREGIPLEVDRQLRLCEARGLDVARLSGVSEISFTRSQMLSQAMLEGKEAVLFVDSDIIFDPRDAIAILRRPEPIVAGAYSQKRYGHMNFDLYDTTTEVPCGDIGGDIEVMGVGAGFLRIRADAARAIIEHHDLPCCTIGDVAVWPFFLPQVAKWKDTGHFAYYAEDYSFCLRAREAGLKIIVDTRVRLFHCGPYPYGFEEAAGHKVKRLSGLVIPALQEARGA